MPDKDAEIAALKAEVARVTSESKRFAVDVSVQIAELMASCSTHRETARAMRHRCDQFESGKIAAEAKYKAAEARVAELEAGLEPFQSIGELIDSETTGFDDDDEIALMLADYLLDRMTVGDFRRARTLLNQDKTNG